jgi:hypothetical protein
MALSLVLRWIMRLLTPMRSANSRVVMNRAEIRRTRRSRFAVGFFFSVGIIDVLARGPLV